MRASRSTEFSSNWSSLLKRLLADTFALCHSRRFVSCGETSRNSTSVSPPKRVVHGDVVRAAGDAGHLDGWPGRYAVLIGDGDRDGRHDPRRLGHRHVHPHAVVDRDCRQRDFTEHAQPIQPHDVLVRRDLVVGPARNGLDLCDDHRLLHVDQARHLNRDDGLPLEGRLREERGCREDHRNRNQSTKAQASHSLSLPYGRKAGANRAQSEGRT